MNLMNENAVVLPLRDHMDASDGWGRVQGREVYPRLLAFIESNPGANVFRVSVKGVKRADFSFFSETVVEIARRYRGAKGFCFLDLEDADMIENCEGAALKKDQPLFIWSSGEPRLIGPKPSKGTSEALSFALRRNEVRVAEFVAANPEISLANASTKFKQLWEQGFLLRREGVAESGGIEYVYYGIG